MHLPNSSGDSNIVATGTRQPVTGTSGGRRKLVDAASLDVYGSNFGVEVLGKYTKFDGASPRQRFQDGRNVLVAWAPMQSRQREARSAREGTRYPRIASL